jgi:hypothetical protein
VPINPETGIWENAPASYSPGPGGPGSILPGLLGITSAFRAQQLSEQADARRKQQELEEIQKAAQGGGANIYEGPAGEQITGAYGIPPETVQQIYEQAPNRRIRARMSDLAQQYEGGSIPSSEIENAYLTEGLPPPTGLYGYMGRQTTAETSRTRIASTALSKATTAGITAMDRSKGLAEDEATQQKAFDTAFLAALSDPAIPKEVRAEVQGKLNEARAKATGGAAPLPQARVEELGTRSELETARIDYMKSEIGIQKAKQAGLDEYRTQLLRLRGMAGGNLTPAQRMRLGNSLTALEAKLGNEKTAQLTMSPQQKAARAEVIPALEAEIKRQKEALAQPTPPAGRAAPEGAYQEGDTATGSGGKKLIYTGGKWTPLS